MSALTADRDARHRQDAAKFTARVVARLIELGHKVKKGDNPAIVDGVSTGYRIGAEYTWKSLRVSYNTATQTGGYNGWRKVSRVAKRKDGYEPVDEVADMIVEHVAARKKAGVECKAQRKREAQSDEIADRLEKEWLPEDEPWAFRGATNVWGTKDAGKVRIKLQASYLVDEDAAHQLLAMIKVFTINADKIKGVG